METLEEVLDFIHRRFPNDSNWTNGNCYYFAVILRERFGGTIYYNTIDGHFVTEINGLVYDHSGTVGCNVKNPWYVKWESFSDYDELQHKRIIQDCIM